MRNPWSREYFRILNLDSALDVLESTNEKLELDITRALKAPVLTNDYEIANVSGDAHLKFISGGGSYIFDDDWLLVVQRSDRTRINPGKLSLFTGRANSLVEFLNPRLVLRELFEEIWLFDHGGSRIVPVSPETSVAASQLISSTRKCSRRSLQVFPATDRALPRLYLVVNWNMVSFRDYLPIMKASSGDLFVLSIVRVNKSINEFMFRDHESRLRQRRLFGLNVNTNELVPIPNQQSFSLKTWKHIARPNCMTEHLQWVINQLSSEVVEPRR